jgi:hypothetical protein
MEVLMKSKKIDILNCSPCERTVLQDLAQLAKEHPNATMLHALAAACFPGDVEAHEMINALSKEDMVNYSQHLVDVITQPN